MQKTKGFYLVCVLALVVTLSGCRATETPAGRQVLSVGMILGSGGLGDRSFNDSAYAGLQKAQEQHGTRFHVITRTTEDADITALRDLLQQGYDLLIGIGFENADYIATLAQEFPERRFAVVDTTVEGANVASIIFREQEGDFLMGVLAATLTRSKKVGFIGGMDIPPIQRIESGFRQGVAFQDASVEIVSAIAGTFADPQVGKSLALAQYAAGVDVIYNGAGLTGLGIIEAAQEADALVIGTSGDQRYLAPGHVVGNRPKRVDTAVQVLIEELESGQFTPGERSLGLAEEGLTLGPFDEDIVTTAMLDRLETLRAQIIAGEIVVEDTLEP